MALKPIEIVINAKDEASKVFDGLNTKLKAVAAAVATYFGISAFSNVIKGAADFEEAMSKVQAVTNTTGEELNALKTAAEQAGASTKFTSIEAANALENLAKAGLNGKEAIAALPAVMAMAQAGGVSLADASERLTGVVMGMGLKFEESGRVADVLAKGANISRTSITGLAEAMSYAAPIAKSVGLSLESTTAIVGQFANAGIDASRAGTALNNILAQFSDPASKFKQELLGLGISTNNFDEALKQLAAAGPNSANAIRAVGLEAGPALQAALNLGIPALAELRKQLESAEGSAKATADIMGKNLNGALAGLGNAWDAVKIKLGEPALPVLTAGVKELTAAFQAAIDNGTITKFGTALATAFQSAIEWVRQFAASFDFNKTAADMQAFAARAGEVFEKIGQYAINAGNIVKLAYGVMSAGTNAVLTGISGIGAAYADMARHVLLSVAAMNEHLSKIAIGDMRGKLKLAAEDARNMAQGFGEASDAMRLKAVESFNDMADGAQMARDGYSGLSGAAGGAKTAVEELSLAATKAKSAKEGLATALQQEWEGLFKAREETEKKNKADSESLKAMADRETKALSLALADNTAADAAKASADAVKQLQDQYKEAMASGDWMKAADLQAQIVKEMAATGPAAENAAAAIGSVASAAATMSGEIKDAINRTGLDFQELSTGISGAATAAITDLNTIIGGLDKLGKAGLDTTRILSASLSKAIDTADSQKALDLVTQKIEEVRKALGDKITDGLLDQAADKSDELADKLDKLAPGIQSIEEAMKQLGLTSDYTLGVTADKAQKAYESIKNNGTASAREIAEAFKVAAEAAIAANNSVAPEWVKAQAAVRGYKIEVDDVGKTTLKTVAANNDLSVALAKSTAAIQTKAAAMKAESELALSGLNLTKSSLEASLRIAEAQGNEKEATRLKIEIKRQEILIIRETVKAQIADAESSIASAKAKRAELEATGQLTPERRAEIDAAIKSGQAKINEAKARGESVRVLEQEINSLQKNSSAYNANSGAIDKTTAALERLNAEREREVAAKEKSNELDEREAELERKRLKRDKEGYSVDANGNRIVQTAENVNSLTNKGMDAGLTATQAQALANKYAPNAQGMFDNNAFWTELNALKIQAAVDADRIAELQRKADAGALSGRDLWEAQQAGIKVPKQPAPAPAPAPASINTPAATPAPAPAPTPPQAGGQGGSMGITPAPTQFTRTVNLNLNGLPLGGINTDASGEEVISSFMDELERSARLAGVI